MDFNIVTFHRSLNYGAVLQTYALQEFIHEQGISVGVFDYCRPPIVDVNPNLRYKVYKAIRSINWDSSAEQKKAEAFASFRDSFLNLNLHTDCKAFIAGSDQIWNMSRRIDSMFFLQFLDKSIYKASYAASMGKSVVPDEKKEIFRDYLQSFDSISVREQDVSECVSKYYDGNISVNIDPTLLHDKEFYEKIEKPIDGINEDFILAYILHIPKNGNKLISWLKKELGTNIILLDSSGTVGLFIKNDIVIKTAGPREFLWLFDHAKAVVTTSFHGTCFSIVFQKEFYSIVNPDSPGRITNLLQMCGLEPVQEFDQSFVRNDKIDWTHVQNVLEFERSKSKAYIGNIFTNAMEKKTTAITGTVEQMRDHCMGCALCEYECQYSAIKMTLNKKGFYEPTIIGDKCIHCSKCIRNCPLNEKIITTPVKAYYGWNKDKQVLFNSSSGGAFFAIANSVIGKNGVVFGATYSDEWINVVFKSTDCVDLHKLQKSKYTVSNPSGVYAEIESKLKEKRTVLFTGTPCQCAGVRKAFGEYNNLITCDFVCGGMASLSFYQEHISMLEKKYHSKITSVDFRPKDWGWGRYHILVKFANGQRYAKRDFADSYFKCFISKASVRESCDGCPYYQFHRSDITIADYWGYKSSGLKKRKEGISMIVCNTKKGQALFEGVLGFEMHVMDVDKTAYTIYNKGPNSKSLDTKRKFFELAEKNGFEAAANEMYDTNELNYYINRGMKMLHIK